MPASVATLRALIEQRFPDAAPLSGGAQSTDGVPTGISALDKALPNHGLPRGRLSVWAPLGAANAILRAACHAVVANGERAAWIDGDNTVAGAFWGGHRDSGGLFLVRPSSRLHALRAADELLRSGGFSLLVLAGAEPQGTETVRLTRAAREGGAAIGTSASMASLRLTSRLLHYHWRLTPFGDPADAERADVRVDAKAAGLSVHTIFPIPVTHHELRLSLESELADRRGLPR
jgi:hypothetical protein